MNKKISIHWHIFLLFLVGTLVVSVVSVFQRTPGYLDADYYFAGGRQLFQGKGFTEPFLWNYLDNPISLPHPSFTYWMPFAGILAALGMKIFNHASWQSGRFLFQLIAIVIPLITYNLAFSFHQKRNLALASGLLTIFCGYYLVFLPITDTFGINILLGGIFLLIACSNFRWRHLLLGMVSGMMYLSRADGLIWLLAAFIWVLLWHLHKKSKLIQKSNFIKEFILILIGFILVAGWWFIRNYQVFGSILPPGNFHTLWLTSYNQIFTIDPAGLTFTEWLKQGFYAAFKVRIYSAGINLQNAVAAQGSILLTPLILIAAWKFRQRLQLQLGAIIWLLIFASMSFIFPFAGARGGFFHSSASLQILNWTLAPIGLETIVNWAGRRRVWNIDKATKVFLISMVSISMVFSGYISMRKLFPLQIGGPSWNSEGDKYKKVNTLLLASGASQKATIMVANPPGFFIESDLRSIAVPDGGFTELLSISRRFSADYLILEGDSLPPGLTSVYNHPDEYIELKLIGQVENALIFKIEN